MTQWPAVVGTVATVAAGLILLACGPFSGEPAPTAVPVFALCQVAEGVSAVAFLRRGRWLPAGLALVAAAVLVYLSLLPVYAEHWTPWSAEPHRHTLWEIGHVH